ncbi:cyclase [Microcoleus vaginatus PCC 9802]|uniref:SRPBCC family protein n=2 Tax=Microcoleus vaginatus TaxID=119532 RepID=UPI00020D2D29|nr:cyclase/dehydrase [Microcoleus vaginatus FGP-2]UNU21070.1 cyclase [Microcoleus vaginatus PCC 9802]
MESTSMTNSDKQNQSSSSGDTERWASLIGGGALVLFGLSQRSLRGALLAVAGGGLAARGLGVVEGLQSAADQNQSIKVEKTVTIDKPADELYRLWRNFENLPRFMKHLKHVTVIDEKRSHWIASAPMGNSVEWDAAIVREEENRLIAWASVEGSDVDNSGFVRFQPASAGRGTEVKVVIEYNPPGGAIGAGAAKLFGEAPEQQIANDLRRFKQLMEAGEIASTEGQSSGRK